MKAFLPTLYYFPLRARAEPIRILLRMGNVAYVDSLVPLANWNEIKSRREICPFGQLPTLQLTDGSLICQSGAIMRYVAKLSKMYPVDPVEAAKTDMVFEFAQEFSSNNPIFNKFPVNSELFTEKYEAFFDLFHQKMREVRILLGSNPFFAGSKPMFGEVQLLHTVDIAISLSPAALSLFPEIHQWYLRMKSIPTVADYFNNRPQPPHIGVEGSFAQSVAAIDSK